MEHRKGKWVDEDFNNQTQQGESSLCLCFKPRRTTARQFQNHLGHTAVPNSAVNCDENMQHFFVILFC